MKKSFCFLLIASAMLLYYHPYNTDTIILKTTHNQDSLIMRSYFLTVWDEKNSIKVSIDDSGKIAIGGCDSAKAIKMLLSRIYFQMQQIGYLEKEAYWFEKKAKFIKN